VGDRIWIFAPVIMLIPDDPLAAAWAVGLAPAVPVIVESNAYPARARTSPAPPTALKRFSISSSIGSVYGLPAIATLGPIAT